MKRSPPPTRLRRKADAELRRLREVERLAREWAASISTNRDKNHIMDNGAAMRLWRIADGTTRYPHGWTVANLGGENVDLCSTCAKVVAAVANGKGAEAKPR